jgi:hypothetical protein
MNFCTESPLTRDLALDRLASVVLVIDFLASCW